MPISLEKLKELSKDDHLVKRAWEDNERLERLGISRDLLKEIQERREILGGIDAIARLSIPLWAGAIPDISRSVAEMFQGSGLAQSIAEASKASLDLHSKLALHTEGLNFYNAALGASLAGIAKHDLESIGASLQYSELAALSANSILASSALAGIDINRLGTAFRIPEDIRNSFASTFENLSTSYRDLIQSFEFPETSLYILPPTISYYPPVEFVNSVTLAALSIEGRTSDESEVYDWQQEIADENFGSVVELLEKYNPDWVPMLEGAKVAIQSATPDKARHSVTSLRELCTHILQHLSPDDEIRAWSTSDEDFHEGRPTRKGRLRFITRHINHGPFTKFVTKDIDSLNEVFNLFQPGTHSVTTPFTDEQIHALIARVEGTIMFLLQLDNTK